MSTTWAIIFGASVVVLLVMVVALTWELSQMVKRYDKLARRL